MTLRKPRPVNLRTMQSKRPFAIKAFLISFGIAFAFFLPFLIIDQGYFLYFGDFNVQQVPFYQMTHDAIRAGNLGWNWYTDLGVNFIGSYSFYNLGSPFFWLTMPFPSDVVPYLMGPLLMLKIGCCGLTGYLFMSRYVKEQWYAVMGGVLYAISGYSIYNIFFNHFHEAMVFFPLLLFALDEFMEKGTRGLFALSVFFCALTNYYFFVGMVAFALIYFFLRMLTGSWTIKISDFLWLAFEAVLGFALSAFLLLPSLYVVAQNPRVGTTTYGWGALLYGHEQRYVHILSSFFFPPDIPARPNFTPDSDSNWASIAAWLPLFGMTGVIAWIQTKKKNWLKKLVIILMVMAFIPILNNAFQLFNYAYYARWFFMLTLVTSLCTVCSLESEEVNWGRALRWSMGFTAAIAVAIGLMPRDMDGGIVTSYGLETYPDRFWIYCAISCGSLLLLAMLLPYLKRNKIKFIKYSMVSVAVVGVLYSCYMLGLGKTQSYETNKFIIPYSLKGGKDNITLPDKKNCRVDVYDPMDNQAMFWQIPTINAFHSIIPRSTMDFYPTVGIPRSVATRPEIQHYGVRALLSVRWMFDYEGDNSAFGSRPDDISSSDSTPPDDDNTVDSTQDNDPKLPGFEYYDTQNNFHVWENKHYIPFGFSYDYFITRTEYDDPNSGFTESDRQLALLRAMVLSDEQQEKYGDIIEHLPEEQFSDFTKERYFQDCLDRRKHSGSYFNWENSDNGGFESIISLDKDSLVFYSVPFEDGWSATVNGETVDVEQVSVGFMAVRVPAGVDNVVKFDYETPGLKNGILISVGATLLFVLYLLAMGFVDRRRKRKTFNQELGIDPLFEVQYNELAAMQVVYTNHLRNRDRADRERETLFKRNNFATTDTADTQTTSWDENADAQNPEPAQTPPAEPEPTPAQSGFSVSTDVFSDDESGVDSPEQ